MRYLQFTCAMAGLVLGSVAVAGTFNCPPMPGAVTDRNRDVKSEIKAQAGSLGKLKAAEVSAQTEVTAKWLLEKFPNADKTLALQTMAATYCEMLRSSASLTDIERLDRWSAFQAAALNIQVSPARPSVPKATASSTASALAKRPPGDRQVARAETALRSRWKLGPGQFPPQSAELLLTPHKMNFRLVTGNNTSVPASGKPYYVSTNFLPHGVVKVAAKRIPMAGRIDGSIGDSTPVCEILRADAEAVAASIGLRLPSIYEWVNAYEGAIIELASQGELVLMSIGEEGKPKQAVLADIHRAGPGKPANTFLSRKVAAYVFPEPAPAGEIPKGCLRMVISVDELSKELGK